MSETAPIRWSRTRWCVTITVVFAAHLGLIFLAAEKPAEAARPRPQGVPMQLVLDPVANARLANQIEDPAQFALPSKQGFSGRAWLEFTPEPLSPEGWLEPDAYLTPEISELGLSFVRYVQTNSKPSFLFAEKRLPRDAIAPLPEEPISVKSRLELREGLAKRGLREPIPIPGSESGEFIEPSVVELAVGADGRVLSCRLVNELLGSKADKSQQIANNKALAILKQARFKPLTVGLPEMFAYDPGKTQWGRVVIFWQPKESTPAPPPN